MAACSICLLDEILENSIGGLGVKVPTVQCPCYGFISLGKLEEAEAAFLFIMSAFIGSRSLVYSGWRV